MERSILITMMNTIVIIFDSLQPYTIDCVELYITLFLCRLHRFQELKKKRFCFRLIQTRMHQFAPMILKMLITIPVVLIDILVDRLI